MERIVLHTSPGYFHRRIAVALAVGFGGGTALLRLHLLSAGWTILGLWGLYALFQLRDPERFIRLLPGARQFIARNALKAGLPGVYLTLVGTEGDARKIAEAISARVDGRRSGSNVR